MKILCIGCGIECETGDEIISCKGLSDNNDDLVSKPMFYNWFYVGTASDMVELAKVMRKRLKVREKLIEGKNCKTS